MRRAKIVCTIGPATSSAENITRLVECGMDVARLNLSHGEYAVHEQVYMDVRRASDEVGRAVGVLVDLQGPKIRTARFKDGPVVLTEGATFTITTREVPATSTRSGRRMPVSPVTWSRATASSSTTANSRSRSPT